MKQDIVEQFEEMLNEQGPVVIAGIEFDRADILKELDPIAYDEELANFADAMGVDLDEEEDDGQPTELEEWMSFDPDC
jgi:TPP-dependent 2-oxoacid decarboxylase